MIKREIMSDCEHRPGVKEATLVVRNLRLTGVDNQNLETLQTDIVKLFGIDDVTYNEKSEVIYLTYDVSHINLENIEEVIRKHGADTHNDWWTYIKVNYYQFVDQNIKDNAKHQPHCCHKVPGTKTS
jgi:hypothetical protein